MTITKVAFSSFLVACMTLIPSNLNPADANLAAAAQNTSSPQSMSSATFVVYATSSSSGANPQGVALTLSNTRDAQYFYVRNTGTVNIMAFSISVTYSVTPARTEFYQCDAGVVFSALNTCASGTRTTLTNSTNTIALSNPLSPNSWIAFELDPKKLTTPTISVSVSSTQIRPALTIDS